MRITPVVFALAAVHGLLGCQVKTPEAPVFETDLYIPIGLEETTGLDLLQDSRYIDGDSSGVEPLTFVLSGDIQEFAVDSLLDQRVSASSAGASLPAVELDPPDPIAVGFPLAALCGCPPPLDSSDVPVPPFGFSDLWQQVPPQQGFEWVRLRSGRMRLRMTNHSGVPFRSGGQSIDAVQVLVRDRVDGQIVCAFRAHDPLPPGGTVDTQGSLDGLAFHNALEVGVFGWSPGSGGHPVSLRHDQGLELRLDFESMVADSALARIPPQRASSSQSVSFGSDLQLQDGSVLDGALPLSLENRLPLSGTVRIVFPEALRDGNPLSLDVPLEAGAPGAPGEASAVLDFTGRTLTAPPGGFLTALRYDMTLEAEGSGVALPIGVHQRVEGGTEEGTLRFESVRGIVDRRRLRIAPSETTFDSPESLDELDFQQASLDIELENSIGFDAVGDLVVRGISAEGESTVAVPLRIEIPAGSSSQKTTAVSHVDETNSPILDLLHGRPRSIVTTGMLTVGESGSPGVVFRTDRVQGRYTLTAPMRARIDSIVHRTDAYHLTLSTEDQERIRDHVDHGVVSGSVENHLPAAVTARIVFAARLEDLESNPGLVLDEVGVPAGIVDPASGRVIRSVEVPLLLTIDPDQIQFFARDEIYTQVVLTVTGPPGNGIVELTALDFATVKAMLRFHLTVEP